MKETYKPIETEEYLGYHIFRPIASWIVKAVAHTPVTPNQLTVMSLVFGIGSGFFLYYADGVLLTSLSVLCLFIANVFDNSDGQLARFRGTESLYGRVFDGLIDNLVFASVYLAACLKFTGEYGPVIWLMGVAAAVSHSLQSSYFDYYRNEYIDIVVKGFKGEKTTSSEILKAIDSNKRQSGRYFERFLLYTYLNYTQVQEKVNKKYIGFRKQNAIPSDYTVTYKRKNLPLLRLWSILGPTAHITYVMFFIAVGAMDQYFIFEIIILNIHMLIMKIVQNRMIQTLKRDLWGEIL